MTRNREWRESSEDMNKGAGEMDEGSGQRQERDRDGWSGGAWLYRGTATEIDMSQMRRGDLGEAL